MTVIRVDAIGRLADSETDRHHFVRKYAEKYSDVVNLELVCCDQDAERSAQIIRNNAYTGERGDGRIFITEIKKAIDIRTGETGVKAL